MSFPSRASLPVAVLLLGLTSGCSAPEGSRAYDVDRYAIDGELDWKGHRLSATASITLTLTEGDLEAIELDSDVSVFAVRIVDVGPVSFTALPEQHHLIVAVDEGPGARAAGQKLTLEIDYAASSSDSLRFVSPLAGDPVNVRAVYTNSEPLGASAWMPCNNVPSDRALFSVAMRVDYGERMIANGTRLDEDEVDPYSSRVRYETEYALPPYLMAFAISDFGVEVDEENGKVPVAVWYRNGVGDPGSHGELLGELRRIMTLYEGLLGPYPFEKYSLVLLPNFPGGMENASITFQSEVDSAEPALHGDLTLAAHELAHQWFGDQVTVATWDDLWIKEGMATLLEHEAVRGHLDASGRGTLNGDELTPEDGVPVRDRFAAPDWKYTSGPYDRAAWLLTQIRSLAGDEAFFAALRGVLDKHRFGSIGTDEFLEAFTPAIGKEATQRARRAVDARALPRLSLREASETDVVVELDDSDGALVAPMDFAWIAANGSSRTVPFGADETASIASKPGELLLVLDPADRHPRWEVFPFGAPETSPSEGLPAENPTNDLYYSYVGPRRAPSTAEGLALFLELAGTHQRAAMASAHGFEGEILQPDAFAGFVEALDSDSAKALARGTACEGAETIQSNPVLYEAWVKEMKDTLATPPPPFGLSFMSEDSCNRIAPPQELFADEFAALSSHASTVDIPGLRLAYLARFRLPEELELTTWPSMAMNGATVFSRKIAVEHLWWDAHNGGSPQRHTTFLELIRKSEVDAVLRWAIGGLLWTVPREGPVNSADLEALRGVLEKDATRSTHAQAVCAAYWLVRLKVTVSPGTVSLSRSPLAWDEFVKSLVAAPLSMRARAFLEEPEKCF